MALTTKTRVELHPIEEDDVGRVADFLHRQLNENVSSDAWARALDVSWTAERPNAGFMLTARDEVVGANIAFYSERVIDGRTERFCNLGAWCVLDDYRLHGLRLLKALVAQDGYHFTDLSPSGNVPAINERLGFQYLDTTTAIVPNLPWPTLPGRVRISANPRVIESTLSGAALQIYRDHRSTAAARHLVASQGGRHCHVIFRKDRRKGLPLFASVLYLSEPDMFAAIAGPLGRYLLLRHGVPLTLLERAVVDHAPRLSKRVASPRRKMFRSSTLRPAQIDYLYSELVCLSW